MALREKQRALGLRDRDLGKTAAAMLPSTASLWHYTQVLKEPPMWAPWQKSARPQAPQHRLRLVVLDRDSVDVVREAPTLSPSADDREYLTSLADQWEKETEFESSPARAAMHPAYQRIVGLGPVAIPLLLERLRDTPGHWFWALAATTGEDPATGSTSLLDARKAWLRWGRERGYID